uniref:Adenylate kinase n=1 Tax=Thermofilum pendens TaxID=2269 RepID=A0A7C4B989_THEPE
MSRVRVVVMGPPGVGKGTYAQAIAARFCVPHISTGELLRREISASTELGLKARSFVEKGVLVPDEIVNEVLCKYLSSEECKSGYVLDGYPRTLAQAVFLETIAPVDIAVLLEAPLEVIIERIFGRLYCPSCGRVYHVKWRPPAVEGVCDYCGAPLTRRRDDDASVVATRFRQFYETSGEVVEFYRKLGKLLVFDASVDSSVGAPQLLKKIEEALSAKLRAETARPEQVAQHSSSMP